jgi:uncharacterized membrane protein
MIIGCRSLGIMCALKESIHTQRISDGHHQYFQLVKVIHRGNKIHSIIVNVIIAMVEALKVNPFFIIEGAVLAIFVSHIHLLKLPF